MRPEIEQLRERIEALETVCAEAYQVAGAIGAPVRVLDQLLAAAEGRPLPHRSVLPFEIEECDEIADLQRIHREVCDLLAPSVYRETGRRGGKVSSPKKARAARANGRKGGRPSARRTNGKTRA